MNKMAEIKEALANCTKGEWIDNGNEIVSSENLNSGIGGFLTDEDNNLVVLLKNNAAALIEKVEQLENQIQAVNQALKDAKGEPSETSEGLIAWLYSTLPFLEEE